jgi:hypothetical protein
MAARRRLKRPLDIPLIVITGLVPAFQMDPRDKPGDDKLHMG